MILISGYLCLSCCAFHSKQPGEMLPHIVTTHLIKIRNNTSCISKYYISFLFICRYLLSWQLPSLQLDVGHGTWCSWCLLRGESVSHKAGAAPEAFIMDGVWMCPEMQHPAHGPFSLALGTDSHPGELHRTQNRQRKRILHCLGSFSWVLLLPEKTVVQ